MFRLASGLQQVFTRPSCSRAYSGIEDFYDTITKSGEVPKVGRAWRTSELRLKSFDDLHKLWFVLLKEKNMLMTQRAEARSIADKAKFPNPYRLKKVRLSMARIKVVLGERERVVAEAKQKIRELYAAQKRMREVEVMASSMATRGSHESNNESVRGEQNDEPIKAAASTSKIEN